MGFRVYGLCFSPLLLICSWQCLELYTWMQIFNAVRLEGPGEAMAGLGVVTLLLRLAQWRAGDVKGLSHSYLWVCMLSCAILRVGRDRCDSSLLESWSPGGWHVSSLESQALGADPSSQGIGTHRKGLASVTCSPRSQA